MEESPINLVSLAVSVILTVAVVGLIGFVFSISQQMQTSYQRTVDASNRMEMFAMYSQYDDVLVSGSDVAEAIFRHVQPGLEVNADGELWTYPLDPDDSLADVFKPNGNIDPLSLYHASLDIAPNGVLRRIIFVFDSTP